MTTKELLISRLNLLSEEDIESLLDADSHMEEKNTLAVNRTVPIMAPIPSSAMNINAGNKGSSANPVEEHLSQPPIPLCQTHISRQRHSVKSSATRYMATPLTTLHKSLAVPTRQPFKAQCEGAAGHI